MKRVLPFLFIGLISLLLIVWIASPWLIKSQVNKALTAYDLRLGEDSVVRLNPFFVSVNISELSLLSGQERVFSLEDSVINLNLAGLIFGTISFDEIYFSDLFLQVENSEAGLNIAGVNIADLTSGSDDVPVSNEEPASYRIKISALDIENTEIVYQHFSEEHQLNLHNVSLEDVAVSNDQQALSLSIDAALNNAPLSVNTEIDLNDFAGNLIVDIQLDDFDLSKVKLFAPELMQKLEGALSLETEATIVLSDGNHNLKVELPETLISIANADIAYDTYRYAGSSQQLQLNKMVLTQSAAGDINLNIEELLVGAESLNLQIMDPTNEADTPAQQLLGNLTVNSQVEMAITNNMSSINAMLPAINIALTDFSAAALPLTYNTHLQSFDISGIDVQLNPDSPPTIIVDLLSMTEPSEFSLSDNSLTPAFNSNFKLDKLETGPYSSLDAEANSPFHITGRDNQYATFDLAGWSRPFTEKLSLDLKANIKEFPLRIVSPYLASSMGLNLHTGQLDTETRVEVRDDKIDGVLDLDIRGLKLGKASDNGEQNSGSGTALTLNAALGVLQDKQGNLNLDIPLSGDMDSPGFGAGGIAGIIIKKAAVIKAKDYALNALVPYANVVKIAGIAGNYALKVRLDPIAFPAGQSDLSDQHREVLNGIAEQLTASKKQLKVCPIANTSDLMSENQPVEEDALDPADIEELHKLNNERSSAVQLYLVETKGIESSRILLCNPTISREPNELAVIEFELD